MATQEMTKVAEAKTAKKQQLSHEQIIAGFQELRNQQRNVASKASELEMERKEHDLVTEALKEIDPDRKCFRMVGGVLVERTVKEVLPALESNYEQLGKVIETLNHQLEVKGKAINEYRELYNLRIRGEEDNSVAADQGGGKETKAASAGVLVAKDS